MRPLKGVPGLPHCYWQWHRHHGLHADILLVRSSQRLQQLWDPLVTSTAAPQRLYGVATRGHTLQPSLGIGFGLPGLAAAYSFLLASFLVHHQQWHRLQTLRLTVNALAPPMFWIPAAALPNNMQPWVSAPASFAWSALADVKRAHR